MRIIVLAGGVGGARFLRGLAATPGAEVTVIGNTGDDITLHGLRVCPTSTRSCTRSAAGSTRTGVGTVRGDLRASGPSWLSTALGPAWFHLGDLDLATHLVRSQMLADGFSLSAVTAALCRTVATGVRLLPMSRRPDRDARASSATPTVAAFRPLPGMVAPGARTRPGVGDGAVRGRRTARPAPGVIEAPSPGPTWCCSTANPVVSIGTILSVPGIREAVETRRHRVVGVSPIIAGAPVRGMADACLTAIGVPTSAAAVGAHYGPGLINGWLVDDEDKAAAADPALAGIEVRIMPLYMRDLAATADIARAALGLAAELA